MRPWCGRAFAELTTPTLHFRSNPHDSDSSISFRSPQQLPASVKCHWQLVSFFQSDAQPRSTSELDVFELARPGAPEPAITGVTDIMNEHSRHDGYFRASKIDSLQNARNYRLVRVIQNQNETLRGKPKQIESKQIEANRSKSKHIEANRSKSKQVEANRSKSKQIDANRCKSKQAK